MQYYNFPGKLIFIALAILVALEEFYAEGFIMILYIGGIVLILILLDLAALRWGADSQDSINSTEWNQRQNWRGFH